MLESLLLDHGALLHAFEGEARLQMVGAHWRCGATNGNKRYLTPNQTIQTKCLHVPTHHFI